MIHSINYDYFLKNNTVENDSLYILILVSASHIDLYNLLEENSESRHVILNIYPPWRKIYMKQFEQGVYFSINLIEIENIDDLKEPVNVYHRILCEFRNLKCPECDKKLPESSLTQANCNLNLFDVKSFLSILKSRNDFDRKMRLNINEIQKSQSSFESSGNNNLLFFTQTQQKFNTQIVHDSVYYQDKFTQHNHQNKSKNNQQQLNSQYLSVNSILDALENVGYYGFVTFKATVQRIGLMKWFSNSYIQSSYFQTTQKQHTQLTQNLQYKYKTQRKLFLFIHQK